MHRLYRNWFVVWAALEVAAGSSLAFGAIPEIIRRMRGHQATVFASAFSHDGTLLATGDHKGRLIVWNIQNGVQELNFQAHNTPIRQLSFSKNGSELASTADEPKWKVWSFPEGKQKLSLPCQRTGIYGLSFLGTSHQALTRNQSGRIEVWSLPNVKSKAWPHGNHSLAVFSADQKLLLTYRRSKQAGVAPDLQLLDIPTGRLVLKPAKAGVMFSRV
jgi:WD40 repeat protein